MSRSKAWTTVSFTCLLHVFSIDILAIPTCPWRSPVRIFRWATVTDLEARHYHVALGTLHACLLFASQIFVCSSYAAELYSERWCALEQWRRCLGNGLSSPPFLCEFILMAPMEKTPESGKCTDHELKLPLDSDMEGFLIHWDWC